MSRVSAMVSARDNVSVLFKKFTQILSKGKFPIVFEGEDEKYYSSRIREYIEDCCWLGMSAKGKKKAIELRGQIRSHEEYGDRLCIFFVDADFDDNSDIEIFSDVYVTPCHSVENFYFGKPFFIRVLRSEFDLSEVCEELDCYERVIELFDRTFDSYIDSIRPFNCVVSALHEMQCNGEHVPPLNLKDLKFSNLIDVKLGYVHKVYDEGRDLSWLSSELEGFLLKEGFLNRFSSEEYMCFRGKQNAEFMRIFINLIKEDRRKKRNREIFKNKGKVDLSMSQVNFLSEFSQYAETPSCLRRFISSQASTFNQCS